MKIFSEPLRIDADCRLEPEVYYAPQGFIITGSGVTLDGNGATLVGQNRSGSGVLIENQRDVTVKNLRVQDYAHGLHARGCENLTITGCHVTATAEEPANTLFLDIWRPAREAYGGGILLEATRHSQITGNDLQHQMNGLLAYHCDHLTVRANNASYCSGWGFHLYATSDCVYEDNCADYCCRWEPRGGRTGHMGADAAGFLIIYSACRNVFRRNLARLGGDGFFLAGLSPQFEAVPCNGNLFEENDGSWSPNIAFEATFSAGNVYRNNYANHCNYGFWLGFSRDGVLDGNQMISNARAGIAVENGFNFEVRRNHFEDNAHGVLLWSKHLPEFAAAVPQNTTSYDWQIADNTFSHNGKAVRIAANQDHGLRPYRVPEGQLPSQWLRPYAHTLRRNRFQDNRVGIETWSVDRTQLEDNVFTGNVEADQILE